MSQGLTLEFRQKFGLLESLKEQSKGITEIAHIRHNGRLIAFIITKEFCQRTTTLEISLESIINLQTFCEENNITKIGLSK